MLNKFYKLAVKSVTDEGNFDGDASVMDVVDLGADIIEQGAFTRTLKHHKGKVFLLGDHDPRNRLGIGELEEQGPKLKIRGMLNLEKQNARDALADLRFNAAHGVPMGLSIGYEIVKHKIADGIRRIKELKLWEVSIVTFPMNPQALVTDVKSVIPFQDLPLAGRELAWDSSAALKRVRDWAEAADSPNEKYRQAFLWFDAENEDQFGAYKLPIADVIDGRLTAVPRGIFAAGGVLVGARGGVDIPEADVPGVRAHLAKYYRKLEATPPWEKSVELLELAERLVELAENDGLSRIVLDKAGLVAVERASRVLGVLQVAAGSLYNSGNADLESEVAQPEPTATDEKQVDDLVKFVKSLRVSS